jgi:predicted DNA-binding transcriptional regulator AlpA
MIVVTMTSSELETLISNSVKKAFEENIPTTHTIEDQLLNIKQASTIISLSVPTIYSLVSKAQIPVSKRGKRLYFSKQELTDWIKAGRRKTVEEINHQAENYLSNKTRG